jgi:hypothetical protein
MYRIGVVSPPPEAEEIHYLEFLIKSESAMKRKTTAFPIKIASWRLATLY